MQYFNYKAFEEKPGLRDVANAQASRLIETEIKFKTVFDEAPIGIALVREEDGTFLQVNKQLCEVLGYSETELLKLSLKNIVNADSGTGEKGFKGNVQYIDKNGTVKWANIVETPLLDELQNSDSNIVIFEDVTDLKQSIGMITEQNKRLMDFSYIVSHNLRSHTSNIQGIVALIESSTSEEERKEMTGMLKRASASLNETLINLNNVVSIQTSVNILTEPLNLHDYINHTLSILNDQIRMKSAVVRNQVAADVILDYNPAYLESILLNFIFNAIRYSHPGRQPYIVLNSYTEKGGRVLEISDNGIGIDLDKVGDQLFGMYKTFSNDPDSKGLGLFISRNQIDAMGGRVTVESTPGEGTTFRIYF